MRITIEPSAGADKWNLPQHTVVVDTPTDECDLGEVLELVTMALRGYGYTVGELEEIDETPVRVD